MTFAQGIELAKAAKALGLVLAVSKGLVQFQVLDKTGAVELEVTEWIDYDEAQEFLALQA